MSKTKDSVPNWYEKLPKQFKKTTKDPTYEKHMIKPNSMIVNIGMTGAGKTNSVVEFLHRKNGRFYEIIVFCGISRDEPLYNYLAEHIDGIQIIDDVSELPLLENYKDSKDKDKEKLIIFDDSVLQDKKVMKEIEKYYMGARKLGFTCYFLAQDFHSVSKFIRRNAHYLQLFKLSDMNDVKTILKKYAIDTDLHSLVHMLQDCTSDPLQFLTIAVNAKPEEKYRRCFIEMLDPSEFVRK